VVPWAPLLANGPHGELGGFGLSTLDSAGCRGRGAVWPGEIATLQREHASSCEAGVAQEPWGILTNVFFCMAEDLDLSLQIRRPDIRSHV